MIRLKYSKLGGILAATYFAVFLVSVYLCLHVLVYNTANSEFSGLLEIIVTLPWSMMLIKLYDALGVIKWHDDLAGGPFFFGVTLSLMMLPGALINAGLCYFVGSRLQRV